MLALKSVKTASRNVNLDAISQPTLQTSYLLVASEKCCKRDILPSRRGHAGIPMPCSYCLNTVIKKTFLDSDASSGTHNPFRH